MINMSRNNGNSYQIPYMVYLSHQPKSIKFAILSSLYPIPENVKRQAKRVLTQQIRNTIPNKYVPDEYNSNQAYYDIPHPLVNINNVLYNMVRLRPQVTGNQIQKIFEDLKKKDFPDYGKPGFYRVRKRINSRKRPASSTRSRSRSR